MIVAQGSGSLSRTQSICASSNNAEQRKANIGGRPGESGHSPDNREDHAPMEDIEAEESHAGAGKAKEPESKPAESHVNRVGSEICPEKDGRPAFR